MRLATALIIAALALVGASSAVAGGGRVPAKISLKLGPAVGQFSGKVKSDESACVADRKVRIVRISGQDVRVGKGFTDSSGAYSIQTAEQSGDWIAKVKHETLGGLECAGAQSRNRSAG